MTTVEAQQPSATCASLRPKPWGYEVILTPPELPYAAKLLHVTSGHRLSLQSHDLKMETMTLVSGEAVLTLEDDCGVLREFRMEPSVGYTVYPGRRHRLSAITDTVVMEASTPEAGITSRFEDDYGRDDEVAGSV